MRTRYVINSAHFFDVFAKRVRRRTYRLIRRTKYVFVRNIFFGKEICFRVYNAIFPSTRQKKNRDTLPMVAYRHVVYYHVYMPPGVLYTEPVRIPYNLYYYYYVIM